MRHRLGEVSVLIDSLLADGEAAGIVRVAVAEASTSLSNTDCERTAEPVRLSARHCTFNLLPGITPGFVGESASVREET